MEQSEKFMKTKYVVGDVVRYKGKLVIILAVNSFVRNLYETSDTYYYLNTNNKIYVKESELEPF